MKWQRARVLPNERTSKHGWAGRLVWTKIAPPVVQPMRGPDHTYGIGAAVALSDGFLAPIADLELLPEFSDADNPDEEIRQ